MFGPQRDRLEQLIWAALRAGIAEGQMSYAMFSLYILCLYTPFVFFMKGNSYPGDQIISINLWLYALLVGRAQEAANHLTAS